MINLVVYDLDGTLIDSASVVTSILNQMKYEIGGSPIDKNDMIPWLSLGGESLIINALGVSKSEASTYLENFRARYMLISTPKGSIYPGVYEALDSLEAAGVNLALCTNKPRKLAEKVLYETGLIDKFTFMSAGGDLPTQKPTPKNLEVCLNYYGASPNNVLFVGDSTIDQALCLSLGIPFVHYVPGYDDGVDGNKIHYKIQHHTELIKLINTFKVH
jgi:phosphoglycolate phosphatase